MACAPGCSSATQGEAIIHHNFHGYRPAKGEIPHRPNGVMISNARGQAIAYALDNLQQRGIMFVAPGDEVYEGMVIAENARDRRSGRQPDQGKETDEHASLGQRQERPAQATPQLTLEIALEYIEDDELVEVTPSIIRLRKRSSVRKTANDPNAGVIKSGRRSASELESRVSMIL